MWRRKILPLVFMEYVPKTEGGAKAVAEGADPSVVEQMEKDGVLAANQDDDKEKDTPEKVENKPDDEEVVEDEPNKKVDPAADKSGTDGDDKKDDEDEGVNRTPKYIPSWKHKEELKKTEERIRSEVGTQVDALNQRIQDLTKNGAVATDGDIDALATEFGLTPETASKLVDKLSDIVDKKVGISTIRKTLDEQLKVTNEQKEEQGFVNEFASADTQKALEEASGGQTINADVKERIKMLAYTSTYAKYRLQDIIRLEAKNLFKEAPREQRSAEAGKGGINRGNAPKSIDQMSPDDILSMSDEEFMKASEDLAKDGSRYSLNKKSKK